MIAALMIRAVVAAALLALVALCADGVARQFGLQRRWIWAGALLTSLMLPVAGGWLPSLGLLERTGLRDAGSAGVLQDVAVIQVTDEPVAVGVSRAGVPFGELLDLGLLTLWIVCSAALLALLVWSAWRLRVASRGGEPARIAGVPAVVAGGFGPAVVGVLRPAVLLPAWVRDLPPLDRRIVAAHEWEHVRARDTLLLAFAAAALVAAPWNLVLWWQHRRLCDAIETDCDARLIARGIDRRAYGLVLLHTAGRSRSFPLLSPSLGRTRSTLEKRILAMTYRAPKHRIARSGGFLALAALALAAACDFASNRAATGPSNPLAPAAGTESADVAATPSPDPAETPEAGTADVYIASIEASGPGELVFMEGDDEIARFEVSRTTTGSAVGGGGVVSASARRVTVTGAGNPIYFVDGVRVETPNLDALDIHRVEVVKGAAAERILGAEAADGVIRVTTRAAAAAEGVQFETVLAPTRRVEATAAGAVGRSIPADANPIYFVDGVRVESVDMETLDIQSIEVIKGAAARTILGEEAVNGVVRITTKGATTLNAPSPTERVRGRAERVQDAVEEAQPTVRQVQQPALEVEASAVRVRQVSERLQAESRRDTAKRQQLSADIRSAHERLRAEAEGRTFATPEEEITFKIRGIIREAFAASGGA